MVNELNAEFAPLLDEVHERIQAIGLADPRVTVAAATVVLGARKVLSIHAVSYTHLTLPTTPYV